jgi:DNA primase
MAVSRDTLDRIKSRLDALEIVREAVPSLKASGPRWKGNCPFHNERTPSFFFMPEKNLWHCFGACQEGGDIFKFFMRLENLSFPEALRALARRAGLTVDWEKDEAGSQRSKEREAIFSLLEEAALFYEDSLRGAADAEPARRHLASRGITAGTVRQFRLGFAPHRGAFLDKALQKGVAIEPLLKGGLAARSERTGRYHDPLGGRLVFPIRDAYGQVVAFGGRALEEEAGPKYLNSAETPVYTKGRHLYGLFEGRGELRERGRAVIVEGYMDVVGLHQAGLATAVAPLGTALTADQAKLLRRYAPEAVLLFDPDAAGERASGRGAEIFLKEDVFVRVAGLPAGQDPDDFVRAQGADALHSLLEGAQDVVDFWLGRLAAETGKFDGLHGRLRQAEGLLKFLAGVPNELLREEWLKRVAARLSLDPAALRREFVRKAGPVSSKAAPAPAARPAPARRGVRSAEEEILQVLAAHPEAWAGRLPVEAHFADPRCRQVFAAWSAQWRRERRLDPAAVPLGPEDAAWLSALVLEDKRFADPLESLARGIKSLEGLALRRERTALEPEVLRMLDGRSPREEQKILRYQTLTRALRAQAPEPAGRTDQP